MSALSKASSTKSQYSSLYDHNTCHHKNSYYSSYKILQLGSMYLLSHISGDTLLPLPCDYQLKPYYIKTLLFAAVLAAGDVETQSTVLRCEYLDFKLQFPVLVQFHRVWYIIIYDLLMLLKALYIIQIQLFSIFDKILLIYAFCLIFLSIVLINDFGAKSSCMYVSYDWCLSFLIHFSLMPPVQTSTL